MSENSSLTLAAAALSEPGPRSNATYRRREQRAWYVYDWANSAFSTTVVAVVLGPHLTGLIAAAAGPTGRVEVAGVEIDYRSAWEWLIALSALTQAVTMPLVGAIADYGRLKKLLPGVTAYAGRSRTRVAETRSGGLMGRSFSICRRT